MTSQRVAIVEKILSANDQLAEQNRRRLDEAGVFSINLMASPGAGKTSLIVKTIEKLASIFRLGVIEGDTAPVTLDADKVSALGVPAVQINTGGDCHLDAVMIGNALPSLPLAELDLLIVENVGNLVCPAAFSLGSHVNVLIASIPEGDDKPYKYPNIYRGIDALVLNKTDLLPYVLFDMEYFKQGVQILNPAASIFPLSCKTEEGFKAWIDWLTGKIEKYAQV
jgi:hydrogenase nickel incorporation protein HypB